MSSIVRSSFFYAYATYKQHKKIQWFRIFYNEPQLWKVVIEHPFPVSISHVQNFNWAGSRSRYSDFLRAGRSGDRIPVGARFSASVQTGPEAHPASCAMGTGSFSGVRCGRGVTLTPHPLLLPRSKIE